MCERVPETKPRASFGPDDETGAAAVEYVMLLGFLTAIVLTLLSWLYPSGGRDLESLVNRWGVVLSEQIAGDEMSKANQSDWAEN